VPAGRARLIPDWFESAMGGLCLPFADENQRVAVVRKRMAERIPIMQLFSMERPSRKTPPARGAAGRKGAPVKAVDPELFDSEALAFAKFVAEREQPNMVGAILDAYLSGQPELFAINNAKNLMARPDTLEKSFVQWLQSGPGHPAR
jgi:hypothetical protein